MKKHFLPFLTAATLLLSAPANAQVLFSDDFSDATYTSTHWTALSSASWATNGNTYGLSSTPPGTQYEFSRIDSLTNLPDFVIEYDSLNSQDTGVFFRSDSTAANAVAFILRPSQNDMYFTTRDGGNFSFTILGGVAANTLAGSDVHVRVTGQGNTFTASIFAPGDLSTPLATTTISGLMATASYTMGTAGTYIYAPTASASRFDNLTVSQLAVPEPGTAVLTLPGLTFAFVFGGRRRRQS